MNVGYLIWSCILEFTYTVETSQRASARLSYQTVVPSGPSIGGIRARHSISLGKISARPPISIDSLRQLHRHHQEAEQQSDSTSQDDRAGPDVG